MAIEEAIRPIIEAQQREMQRRYHDEQLKRRALGRIAVPHRATADNSQTVTAVRCSDGTTYVVDAKGVRRRVK